jgi:peroxiredoxin (alkyl hydroperoxide reductase subunit C)
LGSQYRRKFRRQDYVSFIEDLSMQVAHFHGVIQPGASDTSAARATFAIGPLWILRAMVYYPMSNGLSFNEILRLVEALQTSEAHGVATPEAWQPSDEVVVTPPKVVDKAEVRSH